MYTQLLGGDSMRLRRASLDVPTLDELVVLVDPAEVFSGRHPALGQPGNIAPFFGTVLQRPTIRGVPAELLADRARAVSTMVSSRQLRRNLRRFANSVRNNDLVNNTSCVTSLCALAADRLTVAATHPVGSDEEWAARFTASQLVTAALDVARTVSPALKQASL